MGYIECPKCDGYGEVKCPKCGGSRFAYGVKAAMNEMMRVKEDEQCSRCHGKFVVQCNECGGTGKIKENKITQDNDDDDSVNENDYTSSDSYTSQSYFDETDSSNIFKSLIIIGGLGGAGAIIGLIMGFLVGVGNSCNKFDGGMGEFNLKNIPNTAENTMKILGIAGLIVGVLIVLYDRKRK